MINDKNNNRSQIFIYFLYFNSHNLYNYTYIFYFCLQKMTVAVLTIALILPKKDIKCAGFHVTQKDEKYGLVI